METDYEQQQRFSPLVAWLHSVRYRHIVSVFDAWVRARGPAPIKVVEIGCAHGRLFSVLQARYAIDYTGIDLDPANVEVAAAR